MKFRLKCKYKCFNKYRADTRENTTAKSKYKYNWKYVQLLDLILPRCPSTKQIFEQNLSRVNFTLHHCACQLMLMRQERFQ